MKHVGVLGVIIIWLLIPSPVSAASTSNNFTVSAEVAAFHTLIVDDTGRIIQIISNSKDHAQIRAYHNYIHKDTLIDVSAQLLAQYRHLIPDGKTAELGTAYTYYNFPAISNSKSKPLLSKEMLVVF